MAAVHVEEVTQRSYILTLSQEEAEALVSTSVMVGGINTYRDIINEIGTALEDVGVSEREDFKESFVRHHPYRADVR